MSAPSRPTIRQWLLLAAALFLLNASLTFQNVWPTPLIAPRPEVSVEVAALLLGSRPTRRSRRGAAGAPGGRTAIWLAALLFVLAIGRYADVTAPALYGRPVNLYWDAQHLPNVGAMFAKVAKPWMIGAFRAGLVAFVVVIGGRSIGRSRASSGAARRKAAACARSRSRRCSSLHSSGPRARRPTAISSRRPCRHVQRSARVRARSALGLRAPCSARSAARAVRPRPCSRARTCC